MPVHILMYHSISERAGDTFDRRWALPVHLFRSHMTMLKRLRIPVLPIDALGDSRNAHGVILTFDDAYVDFASTAWPVLQAHKYPAAVMVPTGHVGGCDDWQCGEDRSHLRPIMDWDMLRLLHRQGVAIESHTITHTDLRTLPIEEAERELRVSREQIEQQLHSECHVLAYPYNRTSTAVSAAARRAGYRAAVGGHWADDHSYNRRRLDMSAAGIISFTIGVLGYRDAARAMKRRLTAVRQELKF
jgi:peptidoglycan/xylan/chitin deacetylase (PgdA/CDA1 family)